MTISHQTVDEQHQEHEDLENNLVQLTLARIFQVRESAGSLDNSQKASTINKICSTTC